jgi:hypothetical protein
MRLSRRPEPFDSDDYIFELKLDGFQALAYRSQLALRTPRRWPRSFRRHWRKL